MNDHKKLLAELEAAQKKHGKFEMMELLIPDASGILKGKRIRPSDFESVCRDGFTFCGGVPLLTGLGETVSGIPYGEDDGDPDIPAFLVPGSIAPIPWSKRPMGQALFRSVGEDGQRFFADPRTVLERAMQPIRDMGLTMVMATELEFYLLDGNSETPRPAVPHVPGTKRLQPGVQVYHPDDLWEIEDFLNDVYDYCDAQNIPADSAIAEYAQGQYEVNLKHLADPVLACDHAVLLKRAIKAAARKHGFVACFMAKPFQESAGSGLHIHLSLVDKDGRNFFSKGRNDLAKPPFSDELRHAIGGLQVTMAETTAINSPNANSYRRLRPDMFAPVEPNWGVNHRVVSLRIPESDADNLRIEHRPAGADANPYLVTAIVMAGIHHGLVNRLEPEPMVPQHGEVTPRLRIPNRWEAAIDLFEKSTILPHYLGEDYCRYYARNRRAESERFHNIISELDFDWYLRAV